MQGAPAVGRIGPGSGKFWADGIAYSDWSANGGSQMYRNGLANGLTDIGGRLYSRTRNGYVQADEADGELWENYEVEDVSYYVNEKGQLIRRTEPGIGTRKVGQQGGPGDPDPWDIVKQSHWLMLRMALHAPDAISINGNVNMVTGFGTDLVYGKNTSILKVLTGPDAGKTTSYWEVPKSVGWDISVGVNFTEYYYVPFGNQPLQLSDFQGFRITVNGGFGFMGADAGIGMTYAPLGDKGFYIAVSRFYGAGDPGPSFNINWGDTNFNR